MAFRPSFSLGRNNVFFQATSVADQSETPAKGNLGVDPRRVPRKPSFAKGFKAGNNQGVTRPNQPPPISQGGYFSTSQPYQANWGLKNGLQRRTKR